MNLVTNAPSSPPPPPAMFVLVGGESKASQGGPHAAREFQHTSLHFIGLAYAELRRAGVPRDRIITIVQLQDYLDDTLGALLTAGRSAPKFILQQRERTEAACALLLAEGGADYDGADVNPATVLNVLTGRQPVCSAKESKLSSGKVVPAGFGGPLFLGLYSHGDSHAVKPRPPETFSRGVAEQAAVPPPHSPMTAEWFAHMPYDSPPGCEHLLNFVASAGAGVDRQGAPRAPAYLYDTQLRRAFHELFEHFPARPVVGLLNHCRSGGMLDFMRRPTARAAYGLDAWPLYLMGSSDAATDSLVGGLWEAWFKAFAATSALGLTLEGLFRSARDKYFRDNAYEVLNAVKVRAYSPEVFELEFSWPGRNAGDIDPWHLDLRAALDAASPWDNDGGDDDVDEAALDSSPTKGRGGSSGRGVFRALEAAYMDGRAFRLLPRGPVRAAAERRAASEMARSPFGPAGLAFGVAEVTTGPHAGGLVVWMGPGPGSTEGPDRWLPEGRDLSGSVPFPAPLVACRGPSKQADLAAVVKAALLTVARPERVFGRASAVDALPIGALFGLSSTPAR